MNEQHVRIDDLDLIAQAQRGDVQAFNGLVLRYQTAMYNLAFRLLDDADLAADVTQDAFIAAFQHLSQFRGSNFRAWLARILTNTCYDALRRRRRAPTSLEAIAAGRADSADQPALVSDAEESPEQFAMRQALSKAIQDCLNQLPLSFRTVAIMSDVQEYSYDEIALALNISLGTVKSRLSRARQKLRDCLRAVQELFPSAYRLSEQKDQTP
ncbi:MAG: sigma-70 family RNA polymerase sigma factor [Anaerolineae bacterium]|nr:sigma-70 family RNA polymerase sigma factor [Anaerolineae bacterium]MDW8299610.1 sigma-70 family RNA polymerase sigma factor [Anaerolineae bacterium]